jgi:hypothetical protein
MILILFLFYGPTSPWPPVLQVLRCGVLCGEDFSPILEDDVSIFMTLEAG